MPSIKLPFARQFFLFPLILALGAFTFLLPGQVIHHRTFDALNAQKQLLESRAATGIKKSFQLFGKTLSDLVNHALFINLTPEGKHLSKEPPLLFFCVTTTAELMIKRETAVTTITLPAQTTSDTRHLTFSFQLFRTCGMMPLEAGA